MYLVYNSDILPESDFAVRSDNRAFQYGDGLFETIRYENGTVWFLPDHINRLMRGMQALHLNRPDELTEETVYKTVMALLSANNLTDQPARIKLQVWRRPGGLYTPATSEADWLITTRPGQPFAIVAKTKLAVFTDFRLSPSPVSAFKTLNALPYVLAGNYRKQLGVDEVILLDTHGHLAECVASNLFWLKDGMLYTPSLNTGCIGGIIRQQFFRSGYPLTEGLFLPAVLADADVIFCVNIAGIQVFKGKSEDLNALLIACSGLTSL